MEAVFQGSTQSPYLPPMKTPSVFFTCIAIWMACAPLSFAQTPDATSLFRQIEAKSNAIAYESGRVTMSIFDARNRARIREIDSWSHTNGSDSKVFVRFQAPADVKGTALLTLKVGGNDSQKLYLPSVGRIQTIGAAQLSDRFMGSDFLFDDLRPVSYADFTFVTKESSASRWLVRGTPSSARTFAYADYVVDPVRLVLLEATYYNAQGRATRKLTVEQIKEVRPGIFRGDLLIMRDLVANRRTELRWSNRVVDKTIPASMFTERELTRF
jgi:hypothetical protein